MSWQRDALAEMGFLSLASHFIDSAIATAKVVNLSYLGQVLHGQILGHIQNLVFGIMAVEEREREDMASSMPVTVDGHEDHLSS